MKNYCDKCSAEIDESIANCPLCGRNVNDVSTLNGTSTYPNYQTQKANKHFIIKLLRIVLIASLLLSCALEFFISNHLHISFYFLASCLLINFAVLLPITHNFSLSTSSIIALLFLTAFLVFIELFSNTFGWALQFVIPFILLAFSVYNGILIVAKGYFNLEYFLPILISSLISTILLIYIYLNKHIIWPSLTAFSASWVAIILIVGIKHNKIKKSIEKKFHF